MASEVTGDGVALLRHRLAAAQGDDGRVMFDPTIIVAFLAAILPLIQNCFSPTPKALRRRLGNRLRLALAIGQETGLDWAESRAKADEVFRLADQATDAELQLLIDDCK